MTSAELRSTRSGHRDNRAERAQVLFFMPQINDVETLRNHLNLKCDEAFTEAQAVKKIQTAVEARDAEKGAGKNGYKYFLIDVTELEHKLALEQHLKDLQNSFATMQAHSDTVNQLSIYVFGSDNNPHNPEESLKKRCEENNVKYVKKPQKPEDFIALFSNDSK